jgi:hypothetical protein
VSLEHLHEPRLELVVDQDVVAVELEAVAVVDDDVLTPAMIAPHQSARPQRPVDQRAKLDPHSRAQRLNHDGVDPTPKLGSGRHAERALHEEHKVLHRPLASVDGIVVLAYLGRDFVGARDQNTRHRGSRLQSTRPAQQKKGPPAHRAFAPRRW